MGGKEPLKAVYFFISAGLYHYPSTEARNMVFATVIMV